MCILATNDFAQTVASEAADLQAVQKINYFVRKLQTHYYAKSRHCSRFRARLIQST
jgi:hypothetical protein